MREVEDAGAALGHELADALWSVIVIAERCGIDLEASFAAAMDGIDDALGPAGAG